MGKETSGADTIEAAPGADTITGASDGAPKPLTQDELDQLHELTRRASLMVATDRNEKRAMFVAPLKSFAQGPAFEEFAAQMDQFRSTYGFDKVLGPHVNCIIVGMTGLRNALTGEPNAG